MNSCISDSASDTQSALQIGIEIQSIDSTLAIQDDTMRVDNVRLIYGDTYVNVQGQDSLFINSQDIQIEFDPELPNYVNPRGLAGGRVEAGVYQNLIFSIEQAPQDGNQDSGFTDENNQYSMIVRGVYKGADFTYKTVPPFVQTFNLGPLQISDDNTQYVYIIRTDVEDWFTNNTSGGLLDPNDSESSEQINFNIDNSFRFEEIQ